MWPSLLMSASFPFSVVPICCDYLNVSLFLSPLLRWDQIQAGPSALPLLNHYQRARQLFRGPPWSSRCRQGKVPHTPTTVTDVLPQVFTHFLVFCVSSIICWTFDLKRLFQNVFTHTLGLRHQIRTQFSPAVENELRDLPNQGHFVFSALGVRTNFRRLEECVIVSTVTQPSVITMPVSHPRQHSTAL